jgi:RNA polymerase sigma factor (sigma-70 family)
VSCGKLQALIQYVRQAANPSPAVHRTDAELLEQFVRHADDSAFAALVQRHGRLVLAVCRRVLPHAEDVEDAFQATFLILVRRAGTIVKRKSVSSWLFGVARRVSFRARAAGQRRRVVESQVTPRPGPDALGEVIWRDLSSILDEEVQRLPGRCRESFILCQLQGRTNAEAARILGCPHGTVLSRLSRARRLLETRLARRGLTLSGVLLAAGVIGGAATAGVPASLAAATTRAARQMITAGRGSAASVLSEPAITLMEGVLRTMWITRLTVVGVMVLAAALLTGGAGLLLYPAQADEGSEGPRERPHQARPAQRPEPKAQEQDEGRARTLDQAHKEVAVLEREFQVREQRWTDEMIEARKRLVAQEEQFRELEQEIAARKERQRSEIKVLEERLHQLRTMLLQIKQVSKEGDAAIKKTKAELRDVEERVKDRLQEQWELRRTDELIKARQALVAADESLRLIERRQAMERARWQSRLDAADQRVMQLQGGAPQGRGPIERRQQQLEEKLDRLLREMTEIRREIKRQR